MRVYSQSPINILSLQQGLPKSQIFRIVQDSTGFIWLGTRDGLVKFDGHTPVVYRAGNSELPFNYIFDLFVDDEQRLWMTSNADYKGFAYLDLDSGRFSHFDKKVLPGLTNDGISAISIAGHDSVMVLTKDFQLNLIDLKTKAVKAWSLSAFLDRPLDVVNTMDLLPDPLNPRAYWITTVDGIFCFDINSEEFTLQLYADGWTPVRFFHDAESFPWLWVSMHFNGGLIAINVIDPSQRRYYGLDATVTFDDHLDTKESPLLFVNDMARKSKNELFVSTTNRGIGVLNTLSGAYDFNLHESEVLRTDFVRSLYTNSKGECWIGADKGGLFYLRSDIAELKVEIFPAAREERSEFRLDAITHLGDDQYMLGFFRYPEMWLWDRREDEFDKIGLSDPALHVISISQQPNKILLATNKGLKYYDPTSGNIRDTPFQIPREVTYTRIIEEDSSGLWIIGWGFGVIHLADSARIFQGGDADGLKHRWTHDLVSDQQGLIWVGQQNGLYNIDKASGTIRTVAHADALAGFEGSNFKALALDKLGRLWIANFSSGLACYEIKDDTILGKVKLAQGLPSDRIYDMICDDEGYIWVWTSDGLCSFYPEPDIKNIRIQYYPDSRFLPVDMDGTWFLKLKSGEIFFGVSGGFAHFDPRKLRMSSQDQPDPPVITGFRVFDQELIHSHIDQSNRYLKLRPKQNFFSIEFSAPASGFVTQQDFRYKLEGIDRDWVQANGQRTATYTDIQPGNYKFYAQVADQNGRWSAISSPLSIELMAPWYATHPAMGLWLSLLVGLFWVVNRILVNREKMRSQLAMERLEAKNLRELDAVKSNFFTQISHEFRTPLTVILGMARQIKGNHSEASVLPKAISAIERNGQLLLKQINQILDLSKLKTRSVSLDLKQGDMVAYLRYLTEAFHGYAESKDVSLQLDADRDIIMDFDAERVKDIFVNLVGNALKYTDEGGKVVVRVQEVKTGEEDALKLTVADNGKGIPAESLDQIFEPYFQVDPANNREGTGLGLATTRQWVEAMGGHISVKSDVSRGSSFQVTLPITRVAQPFLPSSVPYQVVVEHQGEMEVTLKDDQEGLPLILIIEDNDDVVAYLTMCLEGYQLIRARDGAEGIDKARNRVPDLVLTDVMMPVKDGYQVCAELRADIATSHIPIIMLTAKATQEEKKTGLSLGADAYLTKPFDAEELLIRVQGLLSQRQLLQEKYRHPGIDPLRSDPKQDQEDQFLDRIQQFVEHHLTQEFSIANMAQSMGMSRVQLYRKIKALTGQSASQYVRLIRLYKARQALRTSDQSISEVAYATGFSDPSYFSKVFKEAFDQTPSQIRDGH